MSKERIRFLVNPTAREGYIKRAQKVQSRMPESSLHELIFPMENLPDHLEAVVVFGGDGSVNGVMNKLPEGCLLVCVPAGSINCFNRSLVDEGLIVNEGQLREGDTEKIPNFRMGEINERKFAFFGGFGRLEVGQGKRVAEWRMKNGFLSREILNYYAGLLAFMENLSPDHESEIMRFASTTRRAGPIYVPSKQKLTDEFVTLVSIKGSRSTQTAAKLCVLYVYSLMKTTPPSNLMEMKQGEFFEIEDPRSGYKEVNVDGLICPLQHNGTILIKRGEKTIKAVALTL